MGLCDLIDRCLAILESQPEYIFHLDAQTVVLEDYLDIRPGQREILKKYIAEGRLIVGPWYLQSDFYLTSGEATVRNLPEGRRAEEEFGKCDAVGYAPDQFGNISQLPQILTQFGIDNFIFGRGLESQSADGRLFPRNSSGRVRTGQLFLPSIYAIGTTTRSISRRKINALEKSADGLRCCRIKVTLYRQAFQ